MARHLTAAQGEADAQQSLCTVNEYADGLGDGSTGGSCLPCAPGTTNPAGEDMHSSTAGECQPWRCAENERVAEYACVACAPGKTRAEGDDASVQAQTGSWTAPDDSTHPAPGWTGLPSVNTYCAAVICDANEHVQGHECTACPAGTTSPAPYCEGNELLSEEDCAAAHAASDNPTTFIWRQHDASGVDTSCLPTICAADERVEANACTACAAGTTNEAGDDASGTDTSCEATICGTNQHVASNVCVDCPTGKTSYAGDDASGADTVCEVCDANYHLVDGACTQCPTGTQRQAGDVEDDATNTVCDRCAENYYVSSGTCTACAPGTTNMDNDDTTGADTSCTATICEPTEHVVSNECVECPAGKVNLHAGRNTVHGIGSGDDASGGDTSCDAILCTENQQVKSNTCVPCSVGYINAEGGDSSGVDTSCSWDGRYCAVHTILPEAEAFCEGDANLLTKEDCTSADLVWTRHRYTLPVWANGAGAGLKTPSNCVADDGSLDCDVYDSNSLVGNEGGDMCTAYVPPSHCRAGDGSDPADTFCDRFDHSEERCLGTSDCFAYDGSDACDVHNSDREACLLSTGVTGTTCQWKDATGPNVSPSGAECTWGAAAQCTWTPAESFEDGSSKVCQSCPAGTSSSGRPCSCALACTF